MIDKGKVAFVARRSVGSSLDGDHASGTTTITVDNTFVFDELGGNLSINGVTYAYTGYDDDASTITLTSGLAADADDGEQVTLLPEAIETYANVVLDGSDPAIDCLVRHALVPWMTLGPRTPELAETVTVQRGVDGFEVLNVLGQPAILDPGDIAVTVGTSYIDGPPTHFVRDSDLVVLTHAEMIAEADPAWITVMDTLDADNGTLVFQSADPGAVAEVYYPAWMLPTGSGEFRVHIDDVTWDGDFSGVLVATVYNAPLMTDGVSHPTAGSSSLYTLDQFSASYSSPTATPVADLFGWYYFEGFHNPGDPMPDHGPAMSNTPDEQFEYSVETFLGQGLPYVLVIFFGPFDYDYPGGGWTTDQVVTVTGVRVVPE